MLTLFRHISQNRRLGIQTKRVPVGVASEEICGPGLDRRGPEDRGRHAKDVRAMRPERDVLYDDAIAQCR